MKKKWLKNDFRLRKELGSRAQWTKMEPCPVSHYRTVSVGNAGLLIDFSCLGPITHVYYSMFDKNPIASVYFKKLLAAFPLFFFYLYTAIALACPFPPTLILLRLQKVRVMVFFISRNIGRCLLHTRERIMEYWNRIRPS